MQDTASSARISSGPVSLARNRPFSGEKNRRVSTKRRHLSKTNLAQNSLCPPQKPTIGSGESQLRSKNHRLCRQKADVSLLAARRQPPHRSIGGTKMVGPTKVHTVRRTLFADDGDDIAAAKSAHTLGGKGAAYRWISPNAVFVILSATLLTIYGMV